jgi:hypothetical protein
MLGGKLRGMLLKALDAIQFLANRLLVTSFRSPSESSQ